jgi:transcriptional regulator with XRE-family HTH domain
MILVKSSRTFFDAIVKSANKVTKAQKYSNSLDYILYDRSSSFNLGLFGSVDGLDCHNISLSQAFAIAKFFDCRLVVECQVTKEKYSSLEFEERKRSGLRYGKLVRTLRELRGLKQYDFSDAINCKPHVISNCETGRDEITCAQLFRLLKEFSFNAYLCFDNFEEEPNVQDRIEFVRKIEKVEKALGELKHVALQYYSKGMSFGEYIELVLPDGKSVGIVMELLECIE